MRPCSPSGVTEINADGTGQACTVVSNQPPGDPGGWTVDLYAFFGRDKRPCWLVRWTIGAPAPGTGSPCVRVIGAVALPQAITYQALVTPPPGVTSTIEVGVMAENITPAVVPVEPQGVR